MRALNLSDALAWSKQQLAAGHQSDGCTHAKDRNFTDCCQMHDLLRRFQPVPPPEADKLLRECITARGHRVWAWLYWCAVVLARRLKFYR